MSDPAGSPALVGEELARACAARDRFMKHLGAELLCAGRGRATVRMRVRPQHLNFNGTCHGGVLFSLADCAFGFSSNTHGVLAAGINAHMTFEQAVHENDVLEAVSIEQSRTRRLAVYAVSVTRQDGARIGAFTGTVYITGRPQPPRADSTTGENP